MRGEDEQSGALFSYLSPEALVPAEHPLRAIRVVVDAALERLSAEFSKLYSPYGCVSAWKKDPLGGVIGVQKGPL